MGPVGAGDAMKAVNNTLLAVNILALGEGLAALVKAGRSGPHRGRDAERLQRAIVRQRGAGPRAGAHRPWPRTFRLALLDKDVGIARAFLQELDVEGPMLDLAGRLLRQARTELGEEADYVEPSG